MQGFFVQAVQIGATDAKEVVPLVQQVRKFLAVGDQYPVVEVPAVCQPHKRGKLSPSKPWPACPKLCLVSVVLTNRRQIQAIDPIVVAGQS